MRFTIVTNGWEVEFVKELGFEWKDSDGED